MKKTLQDQYLLIKEGKGHRDIFIKEAKQQFPGLIRNSATYTEVANVLKTKNLINENVVGLEPINQLKSSKKEPYEIAFEKFIAESKKEYFDDEKAEVKKPSKQVEEDAEKNFDYEDKKNPDNLIFDQIMKGYYTEMKDPKNESKTMEQLKAIVIKNLEKNPIYYTEKGQFGVKDLGYTMDTPGLGEPKEAKGKFKSSGYGNLNEEKKIPIPYTGQARPTTPEEDEADRQEKEREENEEDVLRGGRLELDEEYFGRDYSKSEYKDMSDEELKQWVKDEGFEDTINYDENGNIKNRNEILNTILGTNVPNTDKYGRFYDDFTTSKEPFQEQQLRKAIREMVDSELEEMININPVKGGGGRRKIPTNYLLPDSIINKLNLSNPGPNAPTYDESAQIPHIKVFSKGEEVILAISDLMYIALKGVTRGRSTRAQNVTKATLQKIQDNFTEKDWPAVRALIKKFAIDRISELPVKGQMRPYHIVSFPEGYSLKVIDDGIMINLPPYKPDNLTESKLKQIIKENINKELSEINKLAEYEVYESKLSKIMELIEKKNSFLERINEDEDMKALTDKKKVKELKKDIKILERAKAKIEKALAKEAKKIKSIPKKEVIDEDEPLDEANLDEDSISQTLKDPEAKDNAQDMFNTLSSIDKLQFANLEEKSKNTTEPDEDDVEPDWEWLNDIKRGR
jgi:hypothetical protein